MSAWMKYFDLKTLFLVLLVFPISVSFGAEAKKPKYIEENPKEAAEANVLLDKLDKMIESKDFQAGEDVAKAALEIAPKLKKSWIYGNLLHKSHLVLGFVALEKNDFKKAESELLASVKGNPGSPQMDTFGPNFALAKAWLEKKGNKKVVLEYIDLCAKFWESEVVKEKSANINLWRSEIKEGKIPDFGANLDY